MVTTTNAKQPTYFIFILLNYAPTRTPSTLTTFESGTAELRTLPIELPEAIAAATSYKVAVVEFKCTLPFLTVLPLRVTFTLLTCGPLFTLRSIPT